MIELKTVLQSAEWDWQAQRYREAHIKYGKAMAFSGEHHGHCRLRRGACAVNVAQLRLEEADNDTENRRNLIVRAANWLAKSEAYLASATEGAPPDLLDQISRYQWARRQTVADWKMAYRNEFAS